MRSDVVIRASRDSDIPTITEIYRQNVIEGTGSFELVPPEASLAPDRELTIFQPAELELGETTKLILDRVNTINPRRIVFDSLSEMRLLAQDPLRYRRQILALKHYFTGRNSTVLLLDDLTSQATDLQLHSISVHRSRLALAASDHLPIVAEFSLNR